MMTKEQVLKLRYRKVKEMSEFGLCTRAHNPVVVPIACVYMHVSSLTTS